MASQETFNSQNLEKYINQIETNCDNIIKAIKEIDSEIGHVVQTKDDNVGLYGEAGARLANLWENNITTINSFDSLFQRWITALKTVYGVNAELVQETSAVYTEKA